MRKIAIFFAIIICIVTGISYMYINYKTNYNQAKRINSQYEMYLNEEVKGREVASVINKVIDSNTKNEVQKDENNRYIDNNTNSINIELKMIDNEEMYSMETIYSGGIEQFITYYGEIKFKCTQIEYHKSTNKIKYMLFEQITT